MSQRIMISDVDVMPYVIAILKFAKVSLTDTFSLLMISMGAEHGGGGGSATHSSSLCRYH